jgi:hypothetical protein
MENNLPVINYASGAIAAPDATFRCATDSIKWLSDNQFEEQEERDVRGVRHG